MAIYWKTSVMTVATLAATVVGAAVKTTGTVPAVLAAPPAGWVEAICDMMRYDECTKDTKMRVYAYAEKMHVQMCK